MRWSVNACLARFPMGAYAVILVLGGCSRSVGGDIGGADISQVDVSLTDASAKDGFEAEVFSIDASTTDGLEAEVFPVDAGEPCTPGNQNCVNGVRWTCSDVGLWAFDPCPAGDVCERGICQPNIAYVYIVVDNTVPFSAAPAFITDPLLLDAANTEACDLNLACCTALDQNGYTATVAPSRLAKYWVRRLAEDLRFDRVRFTLLHLPAVETGTPLRPCSASEDLPLPAACAGRLYQIRDEDDATQAMSTALGVDYATSTNSWSRWFPAPIPRQGTTLDAARSFLHEVVATGPAADTNDVLRWVDEVEETTPIGTSCVADEDCPGGLCQAGQCLRHTNPELPFWPVEGLRPLPWLAYTAMGVIGTSEGDSCTTDSDCGIPEFRCGTDGLCHDEARHCRQRHVVLLSTFTKPYPDWESTDCSWGQDVDPSIWTHWQRWGCACRGSDSCPAGAVCIDSGSCAPNLESGENECWTFNECMPSDLNAILEAGPPYEPYGDLYGFFHDVCTAFPTSAPLDRNGDVLRVHTHTIVTYQPSSLELGRFDLSAGAAIIGDGTFVTPCGSDLPSGWSDGVLSCDYETQYQSLLAAIRTGLADAVCGPD